MPHFSLSHLLFRHKSEHLLCTCQRKLLNIEIVTSDFWHFSSTTFCHMIPQATWVPMSTWTLGEQRCKTGKLVEHKILTEWVTYDTNPCYELLQSGGLQLHMFSICWFKDTMQMRLCLCCQSNNKSKQTPDMRNLLSVIKWPSTVLLIYIVVPWKV